MIHTTNSNVKAILDSMGSEQQYVQHLRNEIEMFENHLEHGDIEPEDVEIDAIFTSISLQATRDTLARHLSLFAPVP